MSKNILFLVHGNYFPQEIEGFKALAENYDTVVELLEPPENMLGALFPVRAGNPVLHNSIHARSKYGGVPPAVLKKILEEGDSITIAGGDVGECHLSCYESIMLHYLKRKKNATVEIPARSSFVPVQLNPTYICTIEELDEETQEKLKDESCLKRHNLMIKYDKIWKNYQEILTHKSARFGQGSWNSLPTDIYRITEEDYISLSDLAQNFRNDPEKLENIFSNCLHHYIEPFGFAYANVRTHLQLNGEPLGSYSMACKDINPIRALKRRFGMNTDARYGMTINITD